MDGHYLGGGSGKLLLPEINIDETQFCGKPDKFNRAVEIQLVHNIGPVIINGLGTDE